jgi:tetratricopeptide (TPR) repeat protein
LAENLPFNRTNYRWINSLLKNRQVTLFGGSFSQIAVEHLKLYMKKVIILFLTIISFNSLAQTSESYRLKAKTFFENGNYKEAISNLTLALKINPKELKALKNRATCYEKIEKYDLALKDNLEALKYDQSAESYGAIAVDYLWLEKYEDARKYIQQSIILEPTNVNFRYNMGLSYQSEKNYEQAIKFYDEALKISPLNSSCQISKTRCLLKLEQFEKASVLVDSFFVTKGFDVEMLLMRGDIKKHFNKLEDALSDFSRALAINPDDLYILNKAANCLEDLEYYDEEIAIRKRLIEVMEKQSETNEYKAINYGMLGIAQHNAFFWEDSLESLNISIKLDESTNAASVLFYRTIVKAKLKDKEGACIDLKRAQELNPDEAENFESFFADDAGYAEFYGYCFPGVN